LKRKLPPLGNMQPLQRSALKSQSENVAYDFASPDASNRAFASAGTPKRGLDASTVAVPLGPWADNLIRVNARKRDRETARRRCGLKQMKACYHALRKETMGGSNDRDIGWRYCVGRHECRGRPRCWDPL
jgi:hypothetical protein